MIEIENGPTTQLPASRRVYHWSEVVYGPRQSGLVPMLLRLRRRLTTPQATRVPGGTVDPAFLRETHHNTYGRPWALGRYQFDYLVERGLAPDDRLLDFGCGSGRFGVWAINYLNADRYFGVDCHQESLEAFTSYEIPLRKLESKSPRVRLDSAFEFDRFGVEFDWVMDFYSSRHLDEEQAPVYYQRVSELLRPGGRLLTSPAPRLPESELADLGLRIEHQARQACPLLSGHHFEDWNDWWELVRV